MSTFSSLGTALSALYAQRQGLDTTGQNVANANTEGYSRQRIRMEATGGATGAQLFSRRTSPDGGVRVVDFQRVRDTFLELRALQENAASASLQSTQTVLSRAELSFSEPGPNGLQAQMADFWASWDDLGNRPNDPGARSQVIEQAKTVVDGFSRAGADLASLQASVTDQLKSRVSDINTTASQIAQLNQAIQNATNSGMTPNDLLDQRDLLITQLSSLVGVTTRDGDAGSVDVFVGGSSLVRGANSEPLGVDVSGAGTASVMWSRLGVAADVGGGEAGALVSAVNTVIPGYRQRLDTVVNQFRDTVNTQHQAGDDLVPGGTTDPLFTGSGATGLAVNATIVADPNRLAAAGAGAGALDSSNALAMAALANLPGGPDASYRSLISDLGADSQRADRQLTIQTQIAGQVDAARKSQSSVNLDEEMTNMISFQHAYDAAARYMTAVDQTLQTLMSTGMVGR